MSKNQESKLPSLRGAPTKYDPKYNDMARRLCLLGFTDVQLAEFFGVCEKTINNWKNEHEDFLLSLKEGKEFADIRVVESLFRRATGFKYDEITYEPDERGEMDESKRVTKTVVPDTGACMAWLKNRQPSQWRDKRDSDDSGSVLKDLITSMTSSATETVKKDEV